MLHIRFLLIALLVLAARPAMAADWIAVVVAPARADAALDRDALALIFERKRLYWPDGARIQPVNLPAADPLRGQFTRSVLNLRPEQLDDYWNGLYFHGVRPPFVLGSGEAVLRFVAATPDAIGYVSACAVDERVRVLMRIAPDGLLHDQLPAEACAAP